MSLNFLCTFLVLRAWYGDSVYILCQKITYIVKNLFSQQISICIFLFHVQQV